MRIQFEIKESLINILDQLMHSDFWATEIKEDESGKKIIKIKDLAYNLEAVAEVMGNEIFIRTALSKYTYRIYEVKGECWCEYVGAYRGFLEQKLLPIITPKENLLECEVLDSSILGGKQKTLREYAEDNLKLKKFREQNFGNNGFSKADHPRRVYDELKKISFRKINKKQRRFDAKRRCFLFIFRQLELVYTNSSEVYPLGNARQL